MFERGNPFPWLDQRKYPWISLTNAAVYLSRRDESGRSRAVYCHEWEPSFSLLFEWIDSGLIVVSESSETGFKRIHKQEFLRVPVKFPSYTLADRLELNSRFQRGNNSYVECNHNLSRFSPAKDRYFVRNSPEPRWRDLRVRSEEVVAALRTIGIDVSDWLVTRSETEGLRVSA